MEVQEVSIDEMWYVLESFGIKRNMLESRHPTNEEITDLYMMIKKVLKKKTMVHQPKIKTVNKLSAN